MIPDLFSRKLVDWNAGDTLETELVVTALKNALTGRLPPRGLIFHPVRGSHYSSEAVKEHLVLRRSTSAWRGLVCCRKIW